MVEAMIALSMLSIGLLGVFTLLANSTGLHRVASHQYIAANLAAEGIEIVRSIADANHIQGSAWNAGLTGCASGCSVEYSSAGLGSDQNNVLRLDDARGLYQYSTGKETPFKRVITITLPNPDELAVVSQVSWKDRGGIVLDVTIEDQFFNWRD